MAPLLSLGGHDVFAKPFPVAEVQWVLQSAWRIGASQPESGNASEAAVSFWCSVKAPGMARQT
jgi:hypothetical protein